MRVKNQARIKILNILRVILKTFRLALPKLGVGWMFALLTINFNRITIVELNITAIAVTAMLAMHYLLSPFQVIFGRFADQHPVFGLRRTPYLLLGSLMASLVFLALPAVALAMGNGASHAFFVGFLLLVLFGISSAMIGDAHHSLIAEVTTQRERGGVISVVWTFTILSTIIAAGIMNSIMPEYTHASMQQLYNLTPLIVIGSSLLGIVGIEKRLTPTEISKALANTNNILPEGNPISVALHQLRENTQARGFFAFIFVSILSIFLQDNILEVFGAEVFAMPLTETTKFQPTWGGGVLIGMVVMGVISVTFGISKRHIALLGCTGTAFGMGILAFAAFSQQQMIVSPALILMGVFTGFFNVGALSMMMDMTIEGATGLYMGMWGMAQAFGNGIASFGGGALHTGLIETGFLAPNVAYFLIFGLEAAGMMTAAAILWHLSVKQFHNLHQANLTHADTVRAMEAGAVA